ncbi:MAG: hypothetical protein H6742_14670 [Alphaproteobacteria bacterium]|nr:hypothetical protein [Alphaproteobacteria bacterium]
MSRTRLASALLALVPLGAVGLLLLPHLLTPDSERWLAATVDGWSEDAPPPEVLAQRRMNPEWDFMSRTFLVLALADRVIAEPEQADALLPVMDAAIVDTLVQEAAHGHGWYLLPYASARPWRGDGRSVFVDGELLLMLGARRTAARAVGRPDRFVAETAERAARVEAAFGAASALPLAESYPDEGWTFCHTLALVGLRMHEHLDGADHSAVRDAWLATARERLIDPATGMLVSEFDMDGRHHDGPEGSTIFLVATALQLVDPELAADQYVRASEALGDRFLGFGYAREWPDGATALVDVDSGPLVPGLGASASASGFAIAASAAFHDHAWSAELRGALGAAEAVMAVHPLLAQAADTPVGDAVVLWGLGFGPLWAEVGAPEPAAGGTASR